MEGCGRDYSVYGNSVAEASVDIFCVTGSILDSILRDCLD